ncbi:hypothetical protein J5226_12110 [Lysobacter sp. K5869]|uniref:hypothetical protein n=1 Tax=Lysobacter sp. K5869 TaxID=2820808 RepID=UPI001C06159A|nr:hypothetical protein [Lysobacter sp. K5869]QWP79077.1 hypothetical protein J5226_12110 [Lysobacter sp. K5869]
MTQSSAPPAAAAARVHAAAPPRKPRAPLSWRYRGAVAARSFAAIVVGYFFAYAFTAFASMALPFSRVDSVIAASLLSFFVWAAVAMYAFAARSAWRACWAPAAIAALLFWAAKLCGALALFPGSAPPAA